MGVFEVFWAFLVFCLVLGLGVGAYYYSRRLLRLDGPTRQDKQQEERFQMLLDREIALAKKRTKR